jgi:hypothetical protein
MSKATQLKIMQDLTINAIESIIARGLMTRAEAVKALEKMSPKEIELLIKATSNFLNNQLA